MAKERSGQYHVAAWLLPRNGKRNSAPFEPLLFCSLLAKLVYGL